MQNFKNKLYNYESPAPEDIWDRIAGELQNEKVFDVTLHRRSKVLFYSAAAAASILLVLFASLFIKHQGEKNFITNHQKTSSQLAQKMKDSIRQNQQILESIIHDPNEKKDIIASDLNEKDKYKKYLTVAGPEGQPVKISQKVATLILYADNEFPPKPIWSNKICKWQEIMLSSTISPTSANLVDLIEMAASSNNLE